MKGITRHCPRELQDCLVQHAPGSILGRVFRESRERYWLYTDEGEMQAELAGALRFHAPGQSELPVVGDWAVLRPLPGEPGHALLTAVLPRITQFRRVRPGDTAQPQVLAANIDVAFLVCGLDADWNPRRLERYLVLTQESGARPVIVLNKSDLVMDPAPIETELHRVAAGVAIHWVSALEGRGLNRLLDSLPQGMTGALLGSSGAGKSTLMNALAGTDQATQKVRESDQRGQHTTTRRELFLLPGERYLIDTPGLRELGIWASEASVEASFTELESVARQCRFRDCRHEGEPGCAVKAALESGELDEERWQSFLKLRGEADRVARQQDIRLREQHHRKTKKACQQGRHYRQTW